MKTVVGLLAALLVVGVAAYLFVLPNFFSTRAKPNAVEEAAVRRLRKLAIPREIRQRTNPIGLSAEVLTEGRAHFADHCAVCHGNDGRGETDMGPNFYPPVPDMTAPVIQSLSDGEMYYAIRNGVRFSGMPAWGSQHGEDDWSDWKLVHFIRHLPKLTKEELSEMEGMKGAEGEEGHKHGAGESHGGGAPNGGEEPKAEPREQEPKHQHQH